MLEKHKFPFNTFKMINKIIYLCERKVSLSAIQKFHMRWNTLYAQKILWLCPEEGYAEPLPHLIFDPTFRKDVQCADSIKKSIL